MTRIFTLLLIIVLITSCDKNKIIYVDHNLADCDGVAPQKCLKVKENKEDEWTLLYDKIEGFDYEEGYNYKIEVKIKKIKNPPPDGSVLKYKLIKVIYQEKSEDNNQQLTFHGDWEVSRLIGIDSLAKLPTLLVDFDSKKVSGNAGCNNYSTSFSIEGNQIKFDNPMATKMMCTNMNVEKAFFDCLQNAYYYKLEDGKLMLFSKENEELLTCNPFQK